MTEKLYISLWRIESTIAIILIVGCSSSKVERESDDINQPPDFSPVNLAVFHFDTDKEELREAMLKTLVAELSKMPEFNVYGQDELGNIREQLMSGTKPRVVIRLRRSGNIQARN